MNSIYDKKNLPKNLIDKNFVCFLCNKGYKSAIGWDMHIHEEHKGKLDVEDFLDFKRLSLNDINADKEKLHEKNEKNPKLKGILKVSDVTGQSHSRKSSPEKEKKTIRSKSRKAKESESSGSEAGDQEKDSKLSSKNDKNRTRKNRTFGLSLYLYSIKLLGFNILNCPS